MNASSPASNSTPSASQDAIDPWVESGAMVYVAITVATTSAIIMCCTWFITHHPMVKTWWKKSNVYNTVEDSDEEVEVQLTAPRTESPTEDVDERTSSQSEPAVALDESAFTLEDSGDESSDEERTAFAAV